MLLFQVLFAVLQFAVRFTTALLDWTAKINKLQLPLIHNLPKLRADSKSLKRLPIHVGIVIVEDEISFADLANLLLWCMAMGISYISIYDVAGVCRQNRQLLESELQRQHNFALGKDANNFDVHFHLGEWNKMEGSTLNNNRVDLMLLSLADGRRGLVTVAKQLTHQVVSGQLRIENIIPSHVDAVLQGQMGFPDPDLVLKFGQVNSLLGYLPWQIRLTSILSLSTHRHITYTSFYRALRDYSSVEQRLGK